jgi:hypothetical protein
MEVVAKVPRAVGYRASTPRSLSGNQDMAAKKQLRRILSGGDVAAIPTKFDRERPIFPNRGSNPTCR